MRTLGWLGVAAAMLFVVSIFTTTQRRMASLDRALKSHASLSEVERLAKSPTHVFTPNAAPSNDLIKPRFWKAELDHEIRHYAMEAMPCYFDLWLLVNRKTREIIDWRLFRLDQAPPS